jgi:hypothetical protein
LNVALQVPVVALAAGDVQPVPYAPSQPTQASSPPLAPLPTAPLPPGGSYGGGNDVIVLKGGGMLRGRLVEVIPNDHATIALSTGQNAFVQWGNIERIEQQGAPGVAAPPPPPPSPFSPTPNLGNAWVHVEADRAVALEGLSPQGNWSVACMAPCDAELPLANDYRITGEGIRSSRVFRITAMAGQHVVINVNPASKGGFTGGVVLTSIGPVVFFIGAIVWLVGEAEASLYSTDSSDNGLSSGQSNGKGAETTGGVMMLVGLGALVGGVVLIVGNSHTKQSQEVVQPPAHAGADWLRLPTWHEAVGPERSIPVAPAVPLFSRSF